MSPPDNASAAVQRNPDADRGADTPADENTVLADLVRRVALWTADPALDSAETLLLEARCPDCYGEGEQGGQFCGGNWTCESCGGSGTRAQQSSV